MMKWFVVTVVLLALTEGGRRRLRHVLRTPGAMRTSFQEGFRRSADPAAFAKEVPPAARSTEAAASMPSSERKSESAER